MSHSWNIRRLGDICTSELGKTRDEKRNKGTFRPYLCAINVQWDRFELSELKEMRFEEGEYDRYTIRKGDLVICEGGDIGRAAIWDNEQPIYYQNALHRVRFSENVKARFVLYYLRFLKQAGILDARYGKGVTIKHLVKSSLVSIPIPVPPIEEQQRIVDELDLLSDIIDKKKAQLRDLDALAQFIFYEMFGSVVEERGIPVSRMDEVFSLITDGTHQTPTYTEDKEYGYKFLSAKDVVGGHIDWDGIKYIPATLHQELYKRLAPRRGDLLLCKNGTTGIAAVVETDEVFDIYVSLALLRPKEGYLPKYLLFAINNQETKRQFNASLKGVGVPNLHLSEIRKTLILTPPIDLQHAFAAKIEAIEQQKALIKQSLQETQTLLSSRMDHYFGE